MMGDPAASAARLRVEIECATWICSHHQNLWQKLHPKFKQTEVWDCPQTWQLLVNMLFSGTYGCWQQMKTTEDLEGLEFS